MDEQTFLTKVKGFTPVIDILANELDMMTALVYGIVWRYCQMEDKVCRASRETIAKHANISAKTVQRHLYELVEKGYLIDTTPKVRHKPHVYKDAGKVIIEGLIEAKLAGGTESPTSEKGETQSPTGLDTESKQGETESPIKRESKRLPKKEVTFDSLQSASPDELPQAFDAHQRTVDQANGSNSLDPITEIVKHLRWLCAGRNAKMPKGKELTNYTKCAKTLLTEKINTDDWQGVCFAIDHWKEHTPQADTWRRDNTKEPHFALDHIAAHYWRIKDRQELDFLDEVPTEPAAPDPLKKWWEDEVLPLHQEWKHARPVSRDNGTLVLSVSAPGPRAHLARHAAGLAGELGLEIRIEEG